jgi:paired box protein 2
VAIVYVQLFQLWTGKWCIKEEHKLLSELGNVAAAAAAIGQTNGGVNNGSITPTSYYESHNGYPATSSGNDSNSLLYDNITTISQSQNSMYTPSIGSAIGEFQYII